MSCILLSHLYVHVLQEDADASGGETPTEMATSATQVSSPASIGENPIEEFDDSICIRRGEDNFIVQSEDIASIQKSCIEDMKKIQEIGKSEDNGIGECEDVTTIQENRSEEIGKSEDKARIHVQYTIACCRQLQYCFAPAIFMF